MINLSTQEHDIIVGNPFTQILSSMIGGTGFAELVYCPLQLLGKDTLLGHLPNNNPLIKAAINSPLVKVVFSGPHGYISPRWHKEQPVPTWNYATVSLTCQLKVIEVNTEKLAAMEQLSNYFDPSWNFNEFNQANNTKMVQHMLSEITVFTLDIIEVSSKFKLSQNRSVACRTAFEKNLRLTGYEELADIQRW